MSETWMSVVSLIITTLTGGFGGWFFGRRKYNAEVKGSEINNFNSTIDAYKKLYDDREKVYQSTIDSLNKRVDELTEENKELRKQIMTVSNIVTAYILKEGINPSSIGLVDGIIDSK